MLLTTQVTYDTALRGVPLIPEYNGMRTKSEEKTRFILQAVADHRMKLHQITKTSIVELLFYHI